MYFLLSMHHISLPPTHHWRLDIVVHAVIIRVQMLSRVDIASWPAMAVETFVCCKVWIERANMRTAI